MTGAKLDLCTDPEKHLFIENNIMGGISTIINRYAKANNKYTEDFSTRLCRLIFLSHTDANNLYGYSVSQPLSTEISDF